MDKKAVLLFGILSVTLVIVSSFLLIELTRWREELTAMREELTILKRENGQYYYNSDWVVRFVGDNPIASATEAEELYFLLVNKAPRKSYWIVYLPEDKGLPLELEALEADSHYAVNGTFRNYAVNCPNARLAIVYSVFKNGTAILENIVSICSGSEYQVYP